MERKEDLIKLSIIIQFPTGYYGKVFSCFSHSGWKLFLEVLFEELGWKAWKNSTNMWVKVCINKSVGKSTKFYQRTRKAYCEMNHFTLFKKLVMGASLLLSMPPSCLVSSARKPYAPEQAIPFSSWKKKKKCFDLFSFLKSCFANIAIPIRKRSSTMLSDGDIWDHVCRFWTWTLRFGFRKAHQLPIQCGYSKFLPGWWDLLKKHSSRPYYHSRWNQFQT